MTYNKTKSTSAPSAIDVADMKIIHINNINIDVLQVSRRHDRKHAERQLNGVNGRVKLNGRKMKNFLEL